MNYNFDDYLNIVKLNIKNKKLHAPICTELESHLQDSADFYVEIGYDEETANKKALEDMGPPHYVADDLAKLHKLSAGQIISEIIFVAIIIIKLFDVLALYFINDFRVWHYIYAEEFAVMLFLVVAGFVLSLRNKRVLPARIAIIYAVTDFLSIIGFWNLMICQLSGKWDVFLYTVHLNYGLSSNTVVILILSVLLAVALTGLLVFTYDRIKTYVRTPNFNSIGFKKTFYLVSIPIVCLTLIGTAWAKNYFYEYSLEERVAFNEVAAELCDYCLENERITKDDIQKVTEHFNYLDFKEIKDDRNSQCQKHLTASVGEYSPSYPHLYICEKTDGSIEIGAAFYTLHDYRSFNPFMIIKALGFDSVWSELGLKTNVLGGADKDEDVCVFTDTVKDNSLRFIYRYDASEDEVIYETFIHYEEGLFGYLNRKVGVDSGKITWSYTDD